MRPRAAAGAERQFAIDVPDRDPTARGNGNAQQIR